MQVCYDMTQHFLSYRVVLAQKKIMFCFCDAIKFSAFCIWLSCVIESPYTRDNIHTYELSILYEYNK